MNQSHSFIEEVKSEEGDMKNSKSNLEGDAVDICQCPFSYEEEMKSETFSKEDMKKSKAVLEREMKKSESIIKGHAKNVVGEAVNLCLLPPFIEEVKNSASGLKVDKQISQSFFERDAKIKVIIKY